MRNLIYFICLLCVHISLSGSIFIVNGDSIHTIESPINNKVILIMLFYLKHMLMVIIVSLLLNNVRLIKNNINTQYLAQSIPIDKIKFHHDRYNQHVSIHTQQINKIMEYHQHQINMYCNHLMKLYSIQWSPIFILFVNNVDDAEMLLLNVYKYLFNRKRLKYWYIINKMILMLYAFYVIQYKNKLHNINYIYIFILIIMCNYVLSIIN